ncbi:MAG: hypothetical protein ACRD3J_07725 [Thermoanaerobaculia bacterium]
MDDAGRSLGLDRIAAGIEAESARLIDLPGFDNDFDLGRVARSLWVWSIAVHRMAESGPASFRSVERGFRDHPLHGEPDPDPLASHRALLDSVSYLTVGDMVLDDFAAMQLARWDLEFGDIPWRTFTRQLDSGDRRGTGQRPIARFLDLALREARARIVAHRRRRHLPSTTWAPDGWFDITMLGLDDRGEAVEGLRGVLREVDLDSTQDFSFLFAR